MINSLIRDTVDAKVHDKITGRLFQIYKDVKLLDSYSVFQAFQTNGILWKMIWSGFIMRENRFAGR